MSTAHYHIPSCTIQPLRDGLAVLRELFNSMHPMNVRHISSAIGVEYSQAEKLLYTLQIEGMVDRDKLGQWAVHRTGLMAAFLKGDRR